MLWPKVLNILLRFCCELSLFLLRWARRRGCAWRCALMRIHLESEPSDRQRNYTHTSRRCLPTPCCSACRMVWKQPPGAGRFLTCWLEGYSCSLHGKNHREPDFKVMCVMGLDLGCECRHEAWNMCKCLISPVLSFFPLSNFLTAELQGMHQDAQLPVDLYNFPFVLLLLGLP